MELEQKAEQILLVNSGNPGDMNDEDWAATVKRNKDNLKKPVEEGFWTTAKSSETPALLTETKPK